MSKSAKKSEAKVEEKTAEKSTEKRPRVVPRLISLLRPEWSALLAVTALTVLSTGLLIIGPTLLGNATNVVFNGVVGKLLPLGETKTQAVATLRAEGQSDLARMLSAMEVTPGVGVDLNELARVLSLVAIVYALTTVFSWIQARMLTNIAERTMFRLREAAEGKLARLPLRYFDTNPHGEILSRVVNDMDNVDTTLHDGLSQLPTSVLTVVGTLAIMYWVSPLLATVSLLTIPVVMAVTIFMAQRSKGEFTAQWDQTGQLTATVEETYAGHAVLQAYGRRKSMDGDFLRRNRRLQRASFPAQFLSSAIFPAVVFVGNLNYVVVAAFGGYQVATGAISLGAVQAFIQYSQRFSSPVIGIAAQMNALQSGVVSAGRIFEFLDAPEEPVLPALLGGSVEAGASPKTASIPDGSIPGGRRIRLEEVSFRYEPDTPLIENLTLEAAPGQTVAIVGPTGAGKTTLVNLLVRFYEIDGGKILLDGVDYRELSRDQVRRCFGMVLQDAWLFHGTIRDNIAFGREDARDHDIFEAAVDAHVDEFVRTLPDGYDTVIDGDATNISSGQKQLLTIARAFLADPGILILDEATSNVDTRTEVMIQAAMARLQAGRTSFVIAHRLSTIKAADTIVVMKAGQVVEQGDHKELMDREGFYYDLYTSQFAETPAP